MNTKHTHKFAWKMYGFEITRRPEKAQYGAPVKPRRVWVYAPLPEGALLGAGVGKDEQYKVLVRNPLAGVRGKRRPNGSEMADFFETLGGALSANMSLNNALMTSARIARSPRLRGVIGTLNHLVSNGEDLAVAMQCFPDTFRPMQVALARAGGETGLDALGAIFSKLGHRLQREDRVWSKLFAELAYPFSLLVMTIIGSIVLELKALPAVVGLFKTLGARLPPITKFFYAIAQFMTVNAWVVFPTAAAVLGAGCWLSVRLGRTTWAQRQAIRLWAIGPILRGLALARALSTFVLLKLSGAKTVSCFELAAASSGNVVVAEFFNACYERVYGGASIEEAFMAERHRLGDDGIRIAGRMEVVMEGGELVELIERVADDLTERADQRINVLPRVLQWPLLALCGAMIGTIVAAMMLPYPTLLADVLEQNLKR
jgi:type IV pilus assembly protein PilC